MQDSDAQWMGRFQDRVTARRIPISGILELTSRCNLRCVHCYLGPQDEQWSHRHRELSTDRLVSIIDEIAAEGCLYLALTGGDPMVHEGFPTIYRHAREQGLIVTVLCNGILIKDHIVELFREYPPATVEISLYGATRETYERVTGVPGSFAKCLKGIERLVDNQLPVKLKTVLMTLNSHEIEAMRRMATQYGTTFRMDSAIFPCLPNGDRAPLELRVSPEEAIRRELADPKQARDWGKHLDQHGSLPPTDRLYVCGAGVTSFYIDPQGLASPCLMTTKYRHSLSERSFADLWQNEMGRLREKKPRDDYGCNTCQMQAACAACPAFNLLETGAEDVRSGYACEATRLRWDAIERAQADAASESWHPVVWDRPPRAQEEETGE